VLALFLETPSDVCQMSPNNMAFKASHDKTLLSVTMYGSSWHNSQLLQEKVLFIW